MQDLLALYHRLPYSAKVAFASVRGLQLQRARYGRDLETLVTEARERETWTEERWRAWHEDRLAPLLDHAARTVPYYRAIWSQRRRSGDKRSWEDLGNWPVLKKEQLRRQPRAFLSEARHSARLYEDHTSGTTGTPLRLWVGQEGLRKWYALLEARARRWNGVNLVDRWAIVGSQLVTRAQRRRPPYWVWNMAGRQLYLSAFHISQETTRLYMLALRRYRATYLLGYPSALHSLATLLEHEEVQPPPLRVVLANAEPLLAYQREALQRVFRCPVKETYGLAEMVAGASECSAGQLHWWPDVGVTEVLQDSEDAPVADASAGRLVCTGLLNPEMPLVRYEVGDRAERPRFARCACGRTLPITPGVDGRLDDVIVTSDGRHLGRLDNIFKADIPVVEAQIVQEQSDLLRVVLVPGRGYDTSAEEALLARVAQRVGPMRVVVQKVAAVPRTANGKVRAVVSLVDRPPCAGVGELEP